jgi:hypothetical protein
MAENYVLLETIELSQSAASVIFDNIPQTGYTDLKVVVSARTSDGNTGTIANLRFNSNTSSYSSRFLNGRGDSSSSGTGSTSAGDIGRLPGVNSPVTDNVFSNTEIYVPNYTSSNFKSYSADSVTEANQTIAYATLTAGLWSNTAAITSITIASSAGSLVQYSTFSLFALAATGTTPVTAPFASGGNIVANDGTYWYHAFLSSGTFTPLKALSCDYLVVAGGGGGGNDTFSSESRGAGGGGAGGLRSTVTATGGGGALESALSLLSNTSYTVTIGAGGIGADGTTERASAGSNSVFATITSVGGGGGGSHLGPSNYVGGDGGSGGGSANNSASGGAASPSGQGFAGGGGSFSSVYTGGGGGGAGAVGVTGTTSAAGAGGAGVLISSLATPTNTGASGYYAGGGGGRGNATNGSGGAGGGGAGGSGNGVANTGGGGGAARFATPGIGGSGIVIVRYPMV